MTKGKILIFFENRMKFHDGLIMRGAIALKLLCPDGVQITVITTISDYVQIVCFPHEMHSLVRTVDRDAAKSLRFGGYTAVFGNKKHPDITMAKSLGAETVIIPPYCTIKLSSASLIFGEQYEYPDLQKFRDLIPKESMRSIRRGTVM